MKWLICAVACVSLWGVSGVAQAAEDPTGTWQWTVTFGDRSREMTLKLKLEGDELTGSMPGRDNQETPIADATFKDGEISFTITRERNGRKSVTKYTGKQSGATITGQIESERNGEKQTRAWEAKRTAL
jgi:hypothetical protein